MSGSACRVCRAVVVPFYRVDSVPTSSCTLHRNKQSAVDRPKGTLELAVCPTCGFIQNQAFQAEAIDYTVPYEDSQGSSPTFRAFAENTIRGLVQRHGLEGKRVFEVGCGKAEWLAMACQIGDMTGLGIDPAYQPGQTDPGVDGRFTVLVEFFGSESQLTGELTACRHTLEHVPNAAEFAGWITAAAKRTPGSVVFVEVPDTRRILAEGAFWDVYYEHCSYFTETSLRNLAGLVGLDLSDLRVGFADQYLLLEASPGSPHPPDEDPAPIVDLAFRFGELAKRATIDWRNRISETAAAGHRVVVWGASSKAVGFITAVGGEITAAVDINSAKHGSYLPGSGIPVVSPSDLPDLAPGLVVVMNPIYLEEIRGMLSQLGLSPRVMALDADSADA